MQAGYKVRRIVQQYNVVSFVVKVNVVVVLGLLFIGATLGAHVTGVQARSFSPCAAQDRTYTVVGGDTLGGIALRYRVNWRTLVSYNHIANANLIYSHQTICIPGRGTVGTGSGNKAPISAPVIHKRKPAPPGSAPSSAPVGYKNGYPYGVCTWWANQRYFQVHGFFVPWMGGAWEWAAQAYQFGWRVSRTPSVGAIVDMQPWVEGAYGDGHVAVVERILGNGRFIASSMNWWPQPWAVTNHEFSSGPGMTFISR